MNEWNKFSVNPPSDFVTSMWVSDGKEVIACMNGSVLSENKCGTMTHWMVRIPPKPPEREKHRCVHPLDPTYYCYENDDGIYIHSENHQTYPSSITELHAKYCPFCGFTLEMK
jgi:hypothetical protein